MLKRIAASTWMLPVFAITLLCLLSASISAQKSDAKTTGAPLKGVDVKLGRYAGAQFGGSPIAATKTDDKGNFAFPVVPRGEYVLTVSLPEKQSRGNGPSDAASNAGIKFCYITLNLAGGKKVEMGYDLSQNKAFDPKANPPSTAKATNLVPLIYVSDGAQPCNGTIVKSKSNITNN